MAPLRALIAAAFAATLAAAAFATEGDVDGAADYPGLGRFGGSVATGFDVKDFDAATVQAAAFKSGQPQDTRRLEGRVTRIAYRTAPGPSILEVARNFENQAKEGGFETLLSCETDACGGLDFANTLDVLPIPQMWVDGFKYRYFAAHRPAGDKEPEAYMALTVSENNQEIYAGLTIVELGAMEDKMVDAAAMAAGLKDVGHISLYGIYFDTDKAVIKPESRPTLDEIAKLLKGEPEMTVYIVGHTDSQGTYDYNMTLSRKRAEAIAADLVKTYGIKPARLKTAGVGFLAPVASNATDAGRALNRRTELVAP